jgi:hypothetical protein
MTAMAATIIVETSTLTVIGKDILNKNFIERVNKKSLTSL